MARAEMPPWLQPHAREKGNTRRENGKRRNLETLLSLPTDQTVHLMESVRFRTKNQLLFSRFRAFGFTQRVAEMPPWLQPHAREKGNTRRENGKGRNLETLLNLSTTRRSIQ
jgi:hypothetical protein